MNKKHIKVAYTSRLSGGSYTQVPKIQMEGRWLEELGFSIGSTIVVEYGEGSLCIRPMTETLLYNFEDRPIHLIHNFLIDFFRHSSNQFFMVSIPSSILFYSTKLSSTSS